MTKDFRFKEFTVKQESNSHKVGTDSMLLGAWTSGDFSRILDIGTGTGILALMMAQKNPKASITAIEPDLESLQEAQFNFSSSPFHDRIMGVHSRLQDFGSIEKFDLIITNPPYFENAFKSIDDDRNRTRHTDDLQTYELYEFASELLTDEGLLNLVIPFEYESQHIERAFDNDLYVQQILHTKRSDGKIKRSLLSFGFEEKDPQIESLIVKDNEGNYSQDYIELTKDFYFKNL